MKKSKVIAATLVVMITVAGGSLFWLSQNQQQPQATQQAPQAETTEAITFNEEGTAVTYGGKEGETALQTLESLTTVSTEESSFGDFVTGINGVFADSTTQYWAFYANGQVANEGAGTYQAHAGDTFEWRLEDL